MNKVINIIIKSFLTLIVILLSSACPPVSTEPCFGCGEDINNVSLEILELTATDSKLKAEGTVSNTGTGTITQPWYIEGKFYADNTHTIIIGVDAYSQTIPLSPGETINWELSISSSDLTISEKEVSDYPNFSVSSLRVYKE